MFRNLLIISSIIVFYSFSNNNAYALSCEDVITSNITLTADLYCSTDQAALVVGADNVTIDMNGFTISGIESTVGIFVIGHNNLTVTNGKFRGINSAVIANQTFGLNVNNIVVYQSGVGVAAITSNNATIEENIFIDTFQGVLIQNDQATTTASYNKITDNIFYRSDTGIYICGNNADNNSLINNFIWKSGTAGIRLIQSDRNQILLNTVIETQNTAIALSSSSYSTIENNNLRIGSIGLSIDANSSAACLASRNGLSYRNSFDSNYSMQFEYGVALGTNRKSIFTWSRNFVSRNSITRNKIYNNEVGIFFNLDAYYNNTYNAYQGTTTPIIDNGVGNSY